MLDCLQYTLLGLLAGYSLIRLRKLEPQSAEAYYERGRSFRCDGAYVEAIADYTDAIRLCPNYALAYNNRAFALRQLGKLAASVTDCDRAIEINPKLVAAYHNRGLGYRELGEYDKAIADYTHALQLDPKFALVFFNRGVAYSYKGDKESAAADYIKAGQLDPKLALNRANRGLDHYRSGKYKKALREYYLALEIDPKCITAYSHLAWLLSVCPARRFRDGNLAVEYATQACEIAEWKNPHLKSTLAAAYAESGDFENAVKWETIYRDTANLNTHETWLAEERLSRYQADLEFTNKSTATASKSV